MRIVMQIRTEHSLAVFGVFHRVQNMRMPEFIHIRAHDDIFRISRVFHEHSQIVPVSALDALGVLASPSFSKLGIHDPELDRLEIKSLYRAERSFSR